MAAAVVVALYAGAMLYMADRPALPQVPRSESAAPGYGTVSMLVALMQTQLDSRGGWLPNDLPPGPGWLLDNKPAFQRGVLRMVRQMTRGLRNDLSRVRAASPVNPELINALNAYSITPTTWAFPSAESKYRAANAALLKFRDHLNDGAHIYRRDDDLLAVLKRLDAELGGVTARLLRAGQPTWARYFSVDEHFYYAQGLAYGMLGVLKALRHDFRDVLKQNNALVAMDDVITSLQHTQFDPWLVTNGSPGGLLPNHANNLKVYLDNAWQKLEILVRIVRRN